MPSEPKDQEGLRAFGAAVRALREEAGLNPEELADRVEISSSSLSRIENGEIDLPWGTARMIARGLGVTTEQLAEVAEIFEATA